jgi:hypothetical protein
LTKHRKKSTSASWLAIIAIVAIALALVLRIAIPVRSWMPRPRHDRHRISLEQYRSAPFQNMMEKRKT